MAARPNDQRPPAPRTAPATAQIAIALGVGLALAVPAAIAAGWSLYPLFAWDIAAVTYMTRAWLKIWRRDAAQTAALAEREDPTRATADLLALCAAGASLVAVGYVIGRAQTAHGAEQTLLAALGVVSIAISWTVVHTIYTLRYARLYYVGQDGGIDFKQDVRPAYTDFAYLAFTVGMTFQVSDTDIQDAVIRKTIMAHALISFVFATCILASTINLIANLG